MHYASPQNYQQALDDFCEKADPSNPLVQAAQKKSVKPLIPVYKKLVDERFARNRSLEVSLLTHDVVKKADAHMAELFDDNAGLKKYHYYYFSEQKTADVDTLERAHKEFYKGDYFNDGDIFSDDSQKEITNDLLHHLGGCLKKELDKEPAAICAERVRYPLHQHVRTLCKESTKHKKFVSENTCSNQESYTLERQADRAIQAIRTDPCFLIEEQSMQIDHLRSLNSTLEYNLARERQKGYDLARKNAELERRVQRRGY